MTERTLLEETLVEETAFDRDVAPPRVDATTQAESHGVADPVATPLAGAIHPWARVLATALRCEAAIDWSAGRPPAAGHSLVVYLESKSHGTAALHLDKGCAAAIVTRLLRTGVVHPQSDPHVVRRAIASCLRESAADILGDDSVGASFEPRPGIPPSELPGAWAAPILLHADLGSDVVSATLRLPRPERGAPPVDTQPVDAQPTSAPPVDAADPVAARILDPLDELELELPVVVALGHATPADLEDWAPGDIWLPDLGWLVPPDVLEGSHGGVAEGQHRAALLLPGAERGIWVHPEGSSLRFDGEALHAGELRDELAPNDAEVRVVAGSARLTLARWRSLTPRSLLRRRGGYPWAVFVKGRLRAWAEPCRWEDAWGVRLLELIAPPVEQEES